jgi:uncharacterized surface protein with fasciclin (FAS1) repeats
MRKVTLLFVALAVLAMSIVPAFAQDDMAMEPTQTIAEIVVASTSAEAPEFTFLLTAIQAADPAVLEALSGEGTFTVFAPTDAAFAALFEELGEEAVAALLADPEALTDILLFHVADVGAPIDAATVGAVLEMSGGSATLETLNGQAIDVVVDEEGTITINGAGLVATDIMATNGVIHVIDAVILPESRDIATIVTEFASVEAMEATDTMPAMMPEFTTLLSAVVGADLAGVLADPEAFFTVFAPTDAAFAALPAETLAAVVGDVELLTSVLTYHVVAGNASTSVLADIAVNAETEGYEFPEFFVGFTEDGGLELATVNGESIVVMIDGMGGITVNESNVVMYDVDASNGVIHVIDAVLVPAGE